MNRTAIHCEPTLFDSLRALPRDYIPQSPDAAGPPIGDPGNDGPTDGPEPESNQNR